MRGPLRQALLLGAGLVAFAPALWAQEEEGGRGEKVDGYLEWRIGDCVIADAQRVCPGPKLKLKGEKGVKSLDQVPLGYEFKAKGKRQRDGSLLATEIEAKPNGAAMFEGEVRAATDQAEAQARQQGRFGDPKQPVGKLLESGPQVERVRTIVDNLLPEYIPRESVRSYVIENKEWNAMAMANYSIYVFTGIIDDLDDDELALVLGHEIAHATNEHSRRQMGRSSLSQILGQAAMIGTSQIGNKTARTIAEQATSLGYSAFNNSYSRDHEDQADRVGMRYAYEAGYDETKGPDLWRKFAAKYGDGDKVTNFFFGDHSLSEKRAADLETEIKNNYADPAKDPPSVAAAGK